MIKILILTAAASVPRICQEQIEPEGWKSFLEQQQQAKTGVVTSNDDNGNNAAVKGIADADPLRATVGATMVQAIKAVDGVVCAAGSLTNALADRLVVVQPGASLGDVVTGISGAAGMTKSAQLTFDGGAQNNAPMTNTVANGTGLATAINAALAAAKPSYSVQSIINKMEDIILADGTKDGVAIIDQEAEVVYLYTGTPANVENAIEQVRDGAIAGALAEFSVDATPAATSENEFGE